MTKRRKGKRTGKFRSVFEATIGPQLEAAGFVYEKRRLAYARVPGTYTPDFSRGPLLVIEAKGYFTAADRAKMLAVKADYFHLDIRFVFQNASNTLSRTSKTTYGEWATQHGFKWCEGPRIPRSWLKP